MYKSHGLHKTTPSGSSNGSPMQSKKNKPYSKDLPDFNPTARSDQIHPSYVPAKKKINLFYLSGKHRQYVLPPLISCSPFIPETLVKHLMHNKKETAIGGKWEDGKNDQITNMEGALHTFVTPILSRVEMTGDYRFAGGHGVAKFDQVNDAPKGGTVWMARTVVMSGLIHPDCEFHDAARDVMLKACRVAPFVLQGVGLDMEKFKVMSVKEKQDEGARGKYDDQLRRHMVYHLTAKRALPAYEDAQAYSFADTIKFLEGIIGRGDFDFNVDQIMDTISRSFVRLPDATNDKISLEMLLQTYCHIVRNEFAALEVLCPEGYVYTYDPPQIFASRFDAGLLNRLFLLAMRLVSRVSLFPHLRIFAFNDYNETPNFLALAANCVGRYGGGVTVVAKKTLFQHPEGFYDVAGRKGLEGARGALLVVHNNSDAFGQNIQFESGGGSMDAIIGQNSNAAAGLARDRVDLCRFVWRG